MQPMSFLAKVNVVLLKDDSTSTVRKGQQHSVYIHDFNIDTEGNSLIRTNRNDYDARYALRNAFLRFLEQHPMMVRNHKDLR